MKTAITIAILTLVAYPTVVAQTQEHHAMDDQKHVQMMQMMKDSSLMDTMMTHVAADRQMGMRMMEKMAEYTGGDTASMQELCAVMMKGKSEHTTERPEGCRMMKHQSMQGRTGEQEKGKREKAAQDKPHKH